MPNRIIRDACKTSPSLAALSDLAERTFWRIIVTLDDFGRYHGTTLALLAAAFPVPPEGLTLDRFQSALDELEAGGLLRFYEIDARRYVMSPTWTKYQRLRARESNYPEPNIHPYSHSEGQEPEGRQQVLSALGRGHRAALRPPLADRIPPPIPPYPPNREPPLGVGDGVGIGVGGGIGNGGGDAVPDPPTARPAGQRPEPPEYLRGCAVCMAMLRCLNEATTRFYNAPGRVGVWLHMAHQGRTEAECLGVIRRQVEELLHKPGKRDFLAPQVLFKPENWDTTVNKSIAPVHRIPRV